MDDSNPIERLIASLAEAPAHVRASVVIALGTPRARGASRPLLGAIRDEDAGVRAAAAQAMGQVGDRRFLKALLQALEDAIADVRASAAESLGKLGDTRANGPLIKSLKDDDGAVRVAAVEALGCLEASEAVGALVRKLRDGDEDVRSAAARVLGQIGDESAIKPLARRLWDEAEDVRTAAAEALTELTDDEAISITAEAIAEGDPTRVYDIASLYAEDDEESSEGANEDDAKDEEDDGKDFRLSLIEEIYRRSLGCVSPFWRAPGRKDAGKYTIAAEAKGETPCDQASPLGVPVPEGGLASASTEGVSVSGPSPFQKDRNENVVPGTETEGGGSPSQLPQSRNLPRTRRHGPHRSGRAVSIHPLLEEIINATSVRRVEESKSQEPKDVKQHTQDQSALPHRPKIVCVPIVEFRGLVEREYGCTFVGTIGSGVKFQVEGYLDGVDEDEVGRFKANLQGEGHELALILLNDLCKEGVIQAGDYRIVS